MQIPVSQSIKISESVSLLRQQQQQQKRNNEQLLLNNTLSRINMSDVSKKVVTVPSSLSSSRKDYNIMQKISNPTPKNLPLPLNITKKVERKVSSDDDVIFID